MSRELYNIEELLMDYLDGNLDKSKAAFVERYLAANPKVAEEIAGLNDIRVEPQYELKYGDKSKLKKTKEFRLPLFTKWAVAATGALLIGSLIWLSIENSNMKNDLAALKNKKIEQVQESQGIASNALPVENAVKITKPNKADKSPAKVMKLTDEPKIGKRAPRSKYNMNTSNQTAVASLETSNIKNKVEASNVSNTLIASNETRQLRSLETKRIPEVINSVNSFNPVLVEEATVYVYTEKEHNKSLVDKILPFELTSMQAKIKTKLKDLNTDNVKEKFRHAFQFQKLKEALVPSSVQQEDLTSIQ